MGYARLGTTYIFEKICRLVSYYSRERIICSLECAPSYLENSELGNLIAKSDCFEVLQIVSSYMINVHLLGKLLMKDVSEARYAGKSCHGSYSQ